VFRRRLRLVRALASQRKPLAFSGLSVMLALGIASALGLARASASVTWRGDYESGNFSQWTLGVQEKVDGRATIVSSPGRQGRYAARYEVDPGDNNVAGSGTGERTEALTSQAATDGYEGHENWYAWSTMFPTGFQAPSDGNWWSYFTQWHNTASTGQAAAINVLGNGTINMRMAGGDPTNPTYTNAVLVSGWQHDTWYDFVVHVRWSSDASIGFYEEFVNGKRVTALKHCPTLYVNQGVYMKQGYYREAQPSTAVIYDDGTRRGSSYEDVIADFPPGTWPSTPGGTVPTTTTSQTTTTAPTTTTATTTTATTTTAPTTTASPPTTTTPPTTTSSSGNGRGGNQGNGNGNGNANGHKKDGSSRFLANATIVRPTAHVRLVSSAIYLTNARSLRISVVARRGTHVRVPILARSKVAGVKTGYWRKTLVTGPLANGRTALQLRVPRSRLHHGERYALRVRVLQPQGLLKTLYLPFRG
jgi:hypothetical protein